MRRPLFVLAVTAALSTGCQTSSTDVARSAGGKAVDAALLGAPRVAEAVAAAAVRPLAPESVSAELLAAAVLCIEEQARIVSANIANANTPAYKQRVAHVTASTMEVGGQRYQVPRIAGVDTNYSVGGLEQTGRVLDLAIDGDGFLEVVLPDGSSGYTRDGRLQINAAGKLVTAAGYELTPEVVLPRDLLDVSIGSAGRIYGRMASCPEEPAVLGEVFLTAFQRPSELVPVDDGFVTARPAAGRPLVGVPGSGGLGVLKQGFLEMSNVEVSRELVRLQLLLKRQETLSDVLAHFGMVAP